MTELWLRMPHGDGHSIDNGCVAELQRALRSTVSNPVYRFVSALGVVMLLASIGAFLGIQPVFPWPSIPLGTVCAVGGLFFTALGLTHLNLTVSADADAITKETYPRLVMPWNSIDALSYRPINDKVALLSVWTDPAAGLIDSTQKRYMWTGRPGMVQMRVSSELAERTSQHAQQLGLPSKR